MLKHCKSLDMNDCCLYIVNRPRIESRAWTTSQQSEPSSGTPPVRTFVKFDIFGDDSESAGLRPWANARNPSNWGTLFPSTGVQINEFDTNDGVEFMKDATLSGADAGSWSRGYRARGQTESPSLDLDGGQERQPTRLRNVVWPSAEGSWERRKLPGTFAITLPVGTLIRTLAGMGMSMMTRTITGHRMHLETLLMHVWH
jgi:hypothetical protein